MQVEMLCGEKTNNIEEAGTCHAGANTLTLSARSYLP